MTVVLPYHRVVKALCLISMNYQLPKAKRVNALRVLLKILVQFTDHPTFPYSESQIKFLYNLISTTREMLLTACRAGGKTELMVIAMFIICIAEKQTRGLWLSGDTMQISEARSKIEAWMPVFQNLCVLTNNKETHQMRLDFTNGSFVDFNPTTKVNGPRVNLLIFDEEGKIMSQDIVRNNKNAYKTTKGTFKHPVRIRHVTTLAIGTPAAVVYKALEPRGLVMKFPATDPRDPYQTQKHKDICSWVEVTDEDLRWGSGHVNCELLCLLDNPEGKRILGAIIIMDSIPAHLLRRTPGFYCRITIDWNATKGHAVMVTITNGEQYWIIAEWNGTDLHAMAVFISRYREIYGESCLVIQEWQGGKTQSREVDLDKYENCKIDSRDPWDAATQQTKIPLAQGATERGMVYAWKGCRVFLEQVETFCWDEKGKIPDDLDDHNVVSWIHSISTVNSFTIDAPTNAGNDGI